MRKYGMMCILVLIVVAGCGKPTARDIPKLRCDNISFYRWDHPKKSETKRLIGRIEDKSEIAMINEAIAKDFVEIDDSWQLLTREMQCCHGRRMISIEYDSDPVDGIVYFRDGCSRELFNVFEKLRLVRRITKDEIKAIEEHVKRIFPSESLNENDPNRPTQEK